MRSSTSASVDASTPASRGDAREHLGEHVAARARSTAPPDIHVCRLAEVDPAEPTAVSAAASTTSSRPSTSRAICWASVTNPWPTSAHAQWTVTTPFSIRHAGGRVVVEAFGEEQVLEPDREADAALHVAGSGRAPRAAGAGEVVVAVVGPAAVRPRTLRITSATGAVPGMT